MRLQLLSKWSVIVVMALALPSMSLSEQACLRNICVDRTHKVGETELELLGMGRLTFWGLRVYTGALFTPPDVRTQSEILGDVPKRLVFHYHRSISRDDIIKAKMEFIDDNPDVDLDAIRDEVEEMNALYSSVRSGDVYELIYEPGKGTTLILNGREEGTVGGAELAKAVFGLWLSDYSLNSGLRDNLLKPYDQ